MSTITRTWRTRASALFVGLAFFTAGAANEALASVTEVQPGDLDGSIPYTGPADPILHFTGDDGNPGNEEVAAALGYTGPRFCERLNSPPGPSGSVTIGTATFNYFYDPTGQTIYWSFDANAPVLWAVSKGGNEAYAFTYLPGGVMSDRLLRSPDTNSDGNPQGLSHFDVCLSQDEPLVTPPEITKTADATWTRQNDWTLDKSADPTAIEMFNGDSHDVDYTVTATKTPWGTFTVSGVIEISDPLDQGFNVDSVADSIIFSADASNTPFHPDLACADVDDATDVIHRCTYSITLSSKVYAFLAAGGGGVNSATAVVSREGVIDQIGPATANFEFPAEPEASFGDTLPVDDTMLPGNPDHTFSDSGVFEYTHTFVCADDEGDNDNTATGTFSTGPSTNGTVTASASVSVDCHEVTVQKTAFTRMNRDFDWSPDKKIVVRPDDVTEQDKGTYCTLLTSGVYTGSYLCDDIVLKLQPEGIYDTVYSLTATKDGGTESGFEVFGTITVTWPADAPEPVFTGDPTDVLTYVAGLPASVNGTVSNCVAGTNQITCDYVAAVPDDRAGTNTASIVRPYVCYASDGSIKACAVPGSATYNGSAGFNFDNADVTETDNCVVMSDLFNDPTDPVLNLGPSFGWEIGEVCASTTVYVTGDINPDPNVFQSLDIHADWAPSVEQCRFMVPNLLTITFEGGGTLDDEAVITVDSCDFGCTFTQGYWKTHAIYAPKPQFAKKRDATWDEVGPLAENTVFFLSGTTWINVFHTPPKGNAYYNLAHQYMAAKLNGFGGASVPASVATAIANAEAWFATYPPSHSFWKTSKGQVTAAAGILGSYNEGSIGPGHCAEAPVAQGAAAIIKGVPVLQLIATETRVK